MRRNVWSEIVSWQTGRLSNSTKYLLHTIDDHHFKEEEMKSDGELSQVCSQIVLKCLFFVKGMYPAPHIHEHLRYTNGYGKLRTSSRTT